MEDGAKEVLNEVAMFGQCQRRGDLGAAEGEVWPRGGGREVPVRCWVMEGPALHRGDCIRYFQPFFSWF